MQVALPYLPFSKTCITDKFHMRSEYYVVQHPFSIPNLSIVLLVQLSNKSKITIPVYIIQNCFKSFEMQSLRQISLILEDQDIVDFKRKGKYTLVSKIKII